jgi:hypothetical protein
MSLDGILVSAFWILIVTPGMAWGRRGWEAFDGRILSFTIVEVTLRLQIPFRET